MRPRPVLFANFKSMYFKNIEWTIGKLVTLKPSINPQPQYQRGEAWDDRKRSLLVDSILSGYDIPKIYLRHTKGGLFDYEVADGQQRLSAIWRFHEGLFALRDLTGANGALNGLHYSTLSTSHKKAVDDYSIIVAIVYQASLDDIRELFRRLQLGVRLNPAELRNSMASALGDQIKAMALTHPFFSVAPFSAARYKADDFLALGFAVLLEPFSIDLKAPELRVLYEKYAKNGNANAARRMNEILLFLVKMLQACPDCINTKWGFVDLISTLNQRNLADVDPIEIAQNYVKWEADRRSGAASLADLAGHKVGTRSRKLFDYISVFQKDGGRKKSLEIRHKILESILFP